MLSLSMLSKTLTGALLVVAGAGFVRANDLETMHYFDTNFVLTKDVSVLMHTRVGTFEDASAFSHFRLGPSVTWRVLPRLSILGGYLYTSQNTRVTHTRRGINRVWPGAQVRIISRPDWKLDSRTIIERFFPPHAEDYWRFRSRAMVIRTTRIGDLFTSGEALVQQGTPYSRYTAGIQVRPHSRVRLAFGYEYRDAPSGPGSHVIVTAFQWEAYRHGGD